MIQTIFLSFVLFVGCVISTLAQSQNVETSESRSDKIKTGWIVGAFPVVGYASDQGYSYGALANFYYFGDGRNYPHYNHSLYFEWSRTTLGGGVNQFKYDSEHLIPHIRVTADAGLFTEEALGFYGFNGYNANYDKEYENKNNIVLGGSPEYYRYQRKLIRLTTDLQGSITDHRFRWLVGYNVLNFKIETVNIENQNKNRQEADKLPVVPLLYDKYVSWGFIPEDQKNGGTVNLVKTGVIWDNRDNEPNPAKGIWAEALVLFAPSFLGNKTAFSKIILTHRQYFTLVKDKLSLAARISYQAKISGTLPFYMEPVIFSSSTLRDGLGGAKTIRGIFRNRLVGDNIVFGNIELRYKAFKTILFNQNFYAAMAGFTDFGRVTSKYKLVAKSIEAEGYLKKGQSENWHQSFGIGFYCAMNQNFIAALNYGFAADKRDGTGGMYIGLDFLF